jgi:hypothetical protein
MTISNFDDVIDSRDVEERISELEEIENPSSEEYEELQQLKALASEGEQYAPDWTYGATLVRDSYFTDYARELLEDCGDLPRDLPHYIAIDWDATARNIRVDYTPVEFDGITYWVR